MNSRFTLNGELEKLLNLTSKGPAKNMAELSEMVLLLARIVIDIHLQLRFEAGSRRTMAQSILTRVVAPLLVGSILWLLFTLGPAIISTVTP